MHATLANETFLVQTPLPSNMQKHVYAIEESWEEVEEVDDQFNSTQPEELQPYREALKTGQTKKPTSDPTF